MKNILTILFIAICSIAIFYSCGSSTGPEEKYKDPREMTWTADTIYYPESMQTLMYRLLGFTNKDIFAYGHSSNPGKVYHYDGVKWEPYDIMSYVGGNLSEMIAFNRNSIYGVGYRGAAEQILAFNYNGKIWQAYGPADNIPGALSAVAGDSPNNIYACGKDGLIYYKNSTGWKEEKINIAMPLNTSLTLNSIAVYKGEVWVIGLAENIEARYYRSFLIKGTTNKWTVVDSINTLYSITTSTRGLHRVIVGKNNKLYSTGTRGFFEWDETRWNLIYNDGMYVHLYVHDYNYMIGLWNINGFGYYDGNSWYNVELETQGGSNVQIVDAWFDGKELFLLGQIVSDFPQKSIIFHGK